MRELLWNAQTRRIEIRFPFDQGLVAVVRDLPGRQWHPDEKSWSVPRDALHEVARRLLPHGFAPSDEVLGLLEDPEGSELPAAPTVVAPRLSPAVDAVGEDPADPEEETWSVSALNERARAILHDRLPFPFWVVGEVVGFDRNAHKSHVFFTLAEKEEGDDAPRATVTAVLFAGARPQIEKTLARAGGEMRLCDGVRVRMRGHVDLYPRTGSFQLVVEAIDPTFTLGEIALRRERILRQVRQAGLAERNLSLPFPVPPLRIALCTSLGSDAYNDFLNELARSGYAFVVTVADVHVQGEKLEPELLASLARFDRDHDLFDVCVITRGGGSPTDLMGFDTPEIAFAVARHPLKVVIGIGHHRDRSVLDEIAHSEKTPTAAAAQLVGLCARAEESLARVADRLGRLLGESTASERSRDLLWRERLLRRMRDRTLGETAAHGRFREQLLRRSGHALRAAELRLRERGLRVAAGLAARLSTARARLDRDRDRLPRAAQHALRFTGEHLAVLAEKVSGRDPQRVLSRGFAWLRRPDGGTVSRVAGLRRGDAIVAQLRDGAVNVQVESVEPQPEQSAEGTGLGESAK